VDDYALLDVGGGARLERFGARITDRPHPGADTPRRAADRWATADLRFDRSTGWVAREDALLDPWTVRLDDLALGLRPTETGQVGLFPEHAASLAWLAGRVTARAGSAADGATPSVLHLFAYTGLVTLALARAGAAVAHVDAARPAVAWARENADRNGLADRPIRWLVDDARAFVAREARRGRRYDGLVLDPPSYGHGSQGGRPWRIEDDLPPLLHACREVLADGAFALLTAHTETFPADRLGMVLVDGLGLDRDATIRSGILALDSEAGGRLELGAYARWDGGA
jgi:23S rRNA (cytosine1962-C5)-methyltransferase